MVKGIENFLNICINKEREREILWLGREEIENRLNIFFCFMNDF